LLSIQPDRLSTCLPCRLWHRLALLAAGSLTLSALLGAFASGSSMPDRLWPSRRDVKVGSRCPDPGGECRRTASCCHAGAPGTNDITAIVNVCSSQRSGCGSRTAAEYVSPTGKLMYPNAKTFTGIASHSTIASGDSASAAVDLTEFCFQAWRAAVGTFQRGRCIAPVRMLLLPNSELTYPNQM
jgi:hypothetical protein